MFACILCLALLGDTQHPLSEPSTIDEQLIGTWMQKDTIYQFLPADTKGIIKIIENSDKPSAFLGFTSIIDGESYLNIVEEKDHSKFYVIIKYKATKEKLKMWFINQKVLRAAISLNLIKGKNTTITDTQENVINFITKNPKIFSEQITAEKIVPVTQLSHGKY